MNIDAVIARPRIYAMEDGVVELMMGLSWAVTGGAFIVPLLLPHGSPKYIFVAQMIWMACSLGMALGIKKLKAMTAQRGGYVAFEERRTSAWWLIPVAFIFLSLAYAGYAIVTRGAFQFITRESFMPLIAGAFPVIVAFAYVAGGLRYRLNYMLWVGGFSALLGLWVYRAGSGTYSIPSVLICEGSVLAIAGAIKLRRFMKRNPRVAEA